jgi:hypothetical protein
VRENNNYPLSTKAEMVAGWKTEFQVKQKELNREVEEWSAFFFLVNFFFSIFSIYLFSKNKFWMDVLG